MHNENLLFKRYKVEDIAGEGGVGIVYKGWDTWINKNVAIKKLKSPEGKDIFLNEYRWQKTIKDERVIKAHSSYCCAGESYSIFDWVEGLSLDKAYKPIWNICANPVRFHLRHPKLSILFSYCPYKRSSHLLGLLNR